MIGVMEHPLRVDFSQKPALISSQGITERYRDSHRSWSSSQRTVVRTSTSMTKELADTAYA
jgi:hypothetical protein